VILQDHVQLLGANEALCFTQGVLDGVLLTGISALWISHLLKTRGLDGVIVIVVGNLVLFVEFLVQFRQNHLFP